MNAHANEQPNPFHQPPYTDTQSLPATLITTVVALELGTGLAAVIITIAVGSPWWVPLVILAALALAPALLLITRLRLQLTEHALRWSFLPFFGKGAIPYHRIKDAEPITIDPLKDFGGWGPKYALKHKQLGLGLIARGPHAVKITWTDKPRPTTITTNHPEQLAQALLERALSTTEEPTANP